MKALILHSLSNSDISRKVAQGKFVANGGIRRMRCGGCKSLTHVIVESGTILKNPQQVFNQCPSGVEKIIVLNCPEGFEYDVFFSSITNGIEIKVRGKAPIRATPQFIFQSTSIAPVKVYSSLAPRFEYQILDLPF